MYNMAKFNDQRFLIELDDNEIFVFGSNLEGKHIGGAAKQAFDHFGAIYGIGVGIQGQSYAIPTMPPLNLPMIGWYIAQFKEWARLTPDTTYYLTSIGTGIAGWLPEDFELFYQDLPNNVIRIQSTITPL